MMEMELMTPALSSANIGIAMGIVNDVAKDAAIWFYKTIILQTCACNRKGRKIYWNS